MKTYLPMLSASFLALFSAAPAADFTSTYVGGTRDWNLGTSWTTPGAPGTFPINGSPSPTYDAIQNSGVLTVNVPIAIQKFNLVGGTLQGAQTLTLGDVLTMENGTITGAGVIQASGGMTLSTGNTKTFTGGRTINLAGGSTWSAGTINAGDGAVFNNAGTFTATNNNTFFQNGIGGAEAQFNNTGTFIKDVGTATTLFSGNVGWGNARFNNSGMVEVRTGTLALDGTGTHAAG
ncbi:MAG: hypothetical protein JNJ83_06190 [Verrucomicrobiaceae bacterium]|nr:hypothetical protein [Verrucomicrobiaceae bacterium]